MTTRAFAMTMMMAGLILGCGTPEPKELPTPIGAQVTTVLPAGFHPTLEDKDKGDDGQELPIGSVVRVLGHGVGMGAHGQDVYQVIVESESVPSAVKEAFGSLDGRQGWIGAPAIDGQ